MCASRRVPQFVFAKSGARLAERRHRKAARQRQSSYLINLDALAACLASAIVW